MCEVGGVDIHYLRSGGRLPAAVMLHGLTGSGGCWTPMANMLVDDFDVVLPDSRGHGRSGAPSHGYTYEHLAVEVEALIAELQLCAPIIAGHSMGGMTAAVVASRKLATLRGLVLIDPTFLTPKRQREVRDSEIDDAHRIALMMTKAELVRFARGLHPTRAGEVIELQAEARLRTRLAAFDVLTPPHPQYQDVVKAIAVPTLLVTGHREHAISPAASRELCRLNPLVRVEKVAASGEGLPFDRPRQLAELLVGFSRSLPRWQ
jgi:pimeloyl-ACP methyl ester carboxylesterase